jgi:hypothetical protein
MYVCMYVEICHLCNGPTHPPTHPPTHTHPLYKHTHTYIYTIYTFTARSRRCPLTHPPTHTLSLSTHICTHMYIYSAEQEEHRRIQRQADAWTPQELHDLFQARTFVLVFLVLWICVGVLDCAGWCLFMQFMCVWIRARLVVWGCGWGRVCLCFVWWWLSRRGAVWRSTVMLHTM